MPKPIYMDNHATTPVDPRVLEAMLPYLREQFGNASSKQHRWGWQAEDAVERARGQVAAGLGARSREIVFTSGATESNNLALKGAWERRPEGRRHIITSAIEHPAVLDVCRWLESQGAELTVVGVDASGVVDPAEVEAALRDDTLLVSLMAANNEIGTLQPLAEVGALTRPRGVLLHTDAAQALGKIPLDVAGLQLDLLSLTAHKLYGPKGVGALYVRRSRPRVQLAPQLHGGGQERGLRSGTLAVPLIVGLGEAVELACQELDQESARIRALRDRLLARLESELDQVHLNGDRERRLPGNLNLSFAYVEGQSLLMGLEQIALSSSSACSSANSEPSHVLQAIGLSRDLAHTALRFGIGRFNDEAEVDAVGEAVVTTVKRLRKLSPLYRPVETS